MKNGMVILLPCDLRWFDERLATGVQRKTTLHIIRKGRIAPEPALVRPRVADIAERSISTMLEAQSDGDLLNLYFGAREHQMDHSLTSVPEELAFDATGIFDREYMTPPLPARPGHGDERHGLARSPHAGRVYTRFHPTTRRCIQRPWYPDPPLNALNHPNRQADRRTWSRTA